MKLFVTTGDHNWQPRKESVKMQVVSNTLITKYLVERQKSFAYLTVVMCTNSRCVMKSYDELKAKMETIQQQMAEERKKNDK